MFKKAWEGRFSEETDKFVEEFTESLSFDKRLALYDIMQNKAHAKALYRAGVLEEEEFKSILRALEEIEKDIKEGKINWKKEYEDVHMNIEAELINRIGKAGGKIHTARSRNDQVATDVKLYIKESIKEIKDLLRRLRIELIKKAEKYIDVVMPSYTHLQRAQPIRASLYFLNFREAFLYDSLRFSNAYVVSDNMPLGSGAVSGIDFPIDRYFTADELNFSKITRNSMYATSDRDFILDFLYACAVTGMHLSRLAEDLIIWASEEFSFINLPDRLCTGSSIMPQKKNPDVLELVRGKTGRLYGNLINLMTVLKGLPSAYNRDLQEDKEPLFDSTDTLKNSIFAVIKIIEGMEINEEKVSKEAGNLLLITDVANYLVGKGIPFREAHAIAGNIAMYVIKERKRLEELSLEEFRKFSQAFSDDIFDILSPQKVADRRISFGGTSRESIINYIEVAKREEGISS